MGDSHLSRSSAFTESFNYYCDWLILNFYTLLYVSYGSQHLRWQNYQPLALHILLTGPAIKLIIYLAAKKDRIRLDQTFMRYNRKKKSLRYKLFHVKNSKNPTARILRTWLRTWERHSWIHSAGYLAFKWDDAIRHENRLFFSWKFK